MIASRQRSVDEPRPQGGFTLVEIMVVVAILALSVRIVSANLGALVPSTILDSEANQLMNSIEYIRSEAQLQGKVFTYEFDLERGRWRIVVPPEDRLVSTQTVEESVPLSWQYLDDRIKFGGFHTLSGHTALSGVSKLVIDENGYTSDTMIYLRHGSPDLEDYVWTIQVYGLESESRLMTSVENEVPRLALIEEAHFR